MKPLVDRTIGDYRIQREVGSGGMGVVYQGFHIRLEQVVAIKDLSPDLASNEEMRQRFIREARIQAQLNHPNVVNVHNLLEHEGHLLLVMEFVEGYTLDQLIQTRGALPYDKAIEITRQVLEALSFMHSKGVIHRDLKPGNIMITRGGLVKVTDFGIAKATSEKEQTRAGVRLGTLWYMSPEQVKGKTVDTRSDLYALGVTFFQMVTGKLPFSGDSDFEIMKAHTDIAPPNPKKIRKDLPKPLSRIILRLLEKRPNKRFQSADEVLRALEEAQGSIEGSTKGALGRRQKVKSVKKPIPRRTRPSFPTLKWIIITAIMLVLAGAIFANWYLNRKTAVIPVMEVPVIEKRVVANHGSEKANNSKNEKAASSLLEDGEKIRKRLESEQGEDKRGGQQLEKKLRREKGRKTLSPEKFIVRGAKKPLEHTPSARSIKSPGSLQKVLSP